MAFLSEDVAQGGKYTCDGGHSFIPTIHIYSPPSARPRWRGCHGDASVSPRRRRDDGNRNIDVGGDTKSNIDVEVSEILRYIPFRNHSQRGLSRNIRFVMVNTSHSGYHSTGVIGYMQLTPSKVYRERRYYTRA